MGYYLGEIFFDNCVNMNGAPRMCAHRRAGLARGAVMPRGGWLREVRRWACCGLRRTPAGRVPDSRFWGVFSSSPYTVPFIVLGLGARHRGIVELSEGG